MHITYDTAMQLYALGFYSKVQQEYPNRNMVFCKNDICFSLGGNISDPLTDEEKQNLYSQQPHTLPCHLF